MGELLVPLAVPGVLVGELLAPLSPAPSFHGSAPASQVSFWCVYHILSKSYLGDLLVFLLLRDIF